VEFQRELARLTAVGEGAIEGLHAYTPNRGLPATIEAIAKRVTAMHPGVTVPPENVVITCGAAGAINIFLRAVCEEGDEILTFAPYFCEYDFYAMNAGAHLKVLPSAERTFEPNIEALRAAFTEKTRVVLINSPNNPSGKVYSQATVDAIGAAVAEATAKFGNTKAVWLVADEPYAKIIYGNPAPKLANVLATPCPHTAVVTSFSKDLSIPGERIGYLAISPKAGSPEVIGTLMASLTFWNRVLGFVNAPCLVQRAIIPCIDAPLDVAWYDARRKALCQGLRDAGLEIDDPEGAFYAFPKVPAGLTDQQFADALAAKCVLAVPGTAFGMPGYLRFSYAVKSLEAIHKAVAIIKQVVADLKK